MCPYFTGDPVLIFTGQSLALDIDQECDRPSELHATYVFMCVHIYLPAEPTVFTFENGPMYLVQVGTRAILTCSVSHDVNASVTLQWTKDAQSIPSHLRVQDSDSNKSQLMFERVVHEDVGQYQCIALTNYFEIQGPEIRTTPTQFVVTGKIIVRKLLYSKIVVRL